MKTFVVGLCIAMCWHAETYGQVNRSTDQVIEGSKVVVELIKVFAGKKETEKPSGCRGTFADLCVLNESENSMTVLLDRASTHEKKELVILPAMKECSLQISVGVWTYDLRQSNTTQSLRKGDILIEGCQNITMNIK